ncbi:hypothetical protein M9458_033465, partial [Cirrhinus mrigala]
QALVMEQEVETLLRKEAIEVVPPHDRESGFYSRYFIVPKKDGGLRPIIDLHWFVTIDLKDAYFHVSILPQHRKGEAYQYRVLPFGLALSPRTFAKCADAALVPLRLQGIRILNYIDDWLILAASKSLAARHRDVVLTHMKTLGLRLNGKKSVLSPLQRRGVGFDHDAGTSVSCSDRVDPRRSRESQRRPVTHCETVSTTAGSDGSRVQHDTFWPAVHETLTVVAQNQGVLPEGKPASQDPVNCPVGTVLEFLQARFSTGLSHSTLKVYVAAISAYHAPLGGLSVGKDPLVVRFLRGVLRLRPPTRPHVPVWDLAVVLEALCRPPFEPIEEIPVRFLTIKTALLLALTSLKRVGDLQALSVALTHLEFAPGMTKAFLYRRPGYVPKVPTKTPQPVVLQAFCPPAFREPDQQKLNCMCPVRALDAYVHRAALWRKSDQLFVCYGPPKKGHPATKQSISRWIIDAISTAYESSDLPSPLGVKAHSTHAMAASKALMLGVPIQDICNAAGWSMPLTFV